MDPSSHRSTDKGLYVAYAQLAQVATEVIGPASQLGAESSWAPDEGRWEFFALLAQASGIRAGTTEILKNILGERVLGLPKD
jgi:alkylation response protein AidB-like acyl-CoA dehydrogenase